MNNKYLTVSVINRYIKHKLDSDDNLQKVFIKGEISNFKAHTTGHLYFSIKDESSKINAIMFSSNALKLNFNPTDGTKVLVIGRVSVYEATGNYQIYVDDMQEDGLGNLYIEFEKLKKKLENEGLFDNKYKKSIPKYPSKIGVITANTGAAIKDILTTIKRRYPIAQVILFPSLVQGDNAAADIVRNINLTQNYDLDVLIIGRGGGSIEDLWPFNEECVARAIFNCSIPIISAVGHEIDFTIADFVSDLRAPTPTAAAELAVPNLLDLNKYINQLKIRLNETIIKQVNIQKLYLESYKNSYIIKNPMILYENKKERLDLLKERLNNSIKQKIKDNSQKIESLIDKLNLVNPLNILKRGFNLAYKDEKIITTTKSLKKNDLVKLKFSKGFAKVRVEEINHEI